MVLGVLGCALTLDRLLKKYTSKSGVFKPEVRLLPMVSLIHAFSMLAYLYDCRRSAVYYSPWGFFSMDGHRNITCFMSYQWLAPPPLDWGTSSQTYLSRLTSLISIVSMQRQQLEQLW